MYFRGIDGKAFWRSRRFWGLVILFAVNVLVYFEVAIPETVYLLLEILGFTTTAVGAAEARKPLTLEDKTFYEEAPDERDGNGG